MSRGFGTTYGTGVASDNIQARFKQAEATQISVSAWVLANSSGQNGLGMIFNQTQGQTTGAGFTLQMNSSASSLFFSQGFSSRTGEWTFPIAASPAWQNIVVTYNGSSTGNVPNAYVNGVPVIVTTLQAPAGTFSSNTNRPLYIGNWSSGNRGFDGMIAHAAYWNGLTLDSGAASALGNGAAPVLINPENLTNYLPLDGVSNPEFDFVPPSSSSSITGTRLGASDPPVQIIGEMPALFDRAIDTAIRFTGSLSLAPAANAAALNLEEKFLAALADMQSPAAAVIAGAEKFASCLSLMAPADAALACGYAMTAHYPGRASDADAMQGGLLALADLANAELATADAALYDVQMTESM